MLVRPVVARWAERRRTGMADRARQYCPARPHSLVRSPGAVKLQCAMAPPHGTHGRRAPVPTILRFNRVLAVAVYAAEPLAADPALIADPNPPAVAASPDTSAQWLAQIAALRFASDAEPWQRSLRWDALPPPRRWVHLGLALAVLVTILELVGFASGMRQRPRPAPPPAPVQVTLIDETPLPLPPEPVAPPFVARPSRIAVAPPEVKTPPPPPRVAEPSDAMRARIGAAGAAGAAPRLLNPDGSVRIGPVAPMPPPPPATERDAAIARWAQIEERGNPLDCQKTRFDKAFSRDESIGDEVARKYLKWIGLADPAGIEARHRARAQTGGCEPAP